MNLSPSLLPKEIPIHRVFPSKGPDQLDWVDDTIFYDVFYKHDNSSIICIGPPLLNLEGVLELQEISCNGRQLHYSHRKTFGDYILVVIKVPRSLRSEFTVQLSFRFNLFEKVVEVSRNHPPVRGNGKNPLTLVTVQKDNPLQWIKDWMRWHNRMHGVRHLVLYDNGSQEYGHDELVDTLHGGEEDFQSVLVNWDFPFTRGGWSPGPAWDPWPKRGALNHWYLKYGSCGWLLNLDIDEYLVAAENTTSLRDYLRQTPRRYLAFRERRVVQIGPEKPLAERSFWDFLYRVSTWPSKPTGELLPHREFPRRYWKYACQCNMPLWLHNHQVTYQGIRGWRSRLEAMFYALIRKFYSRIRYVMGLNSINSRPMEILRGEMFWVYHFMSLSTRWGPYHKTETERPSYYPQKGYFDSRWQDGKKTIGRPPYCDKAYFEAYGTEVIYDDTMIKQAEKYGL